MVKNCNPNEEGEVTIVEQNTTFIFCVLKIFVAEGKQELFCSMNYNEKACWSSTHQKIKGICCIKTNRFK